MTVVEYKGMSWDSEETVTYPEPLECTMAIDRLWKLQMKGKTTLNFHRNSAKYKPQAVFSVYSRVYPTREERPFNNNWARAETPFSISSATRDFFSECARTVDAKLWGL